MMSSEAIGGLLFFGIIAIAIVLLVGFLYLLKKLINDSSRVNGDMTGGQTFSGDYMATVMINGVQYSGNTIQIRNDQVLIDGQDISNTVGVKKIMEIRILEGTLNQLTTDASVTCLDVTGSVTARGSVSCLKVGGSVDAGGSITCDSVQGDVDAGGSVNCGSVGGSIDAGGSVRHG